jgi:hypothetical protein
LGDTPDRTSRGAEEIVEGLEHDLLLDPQPLELSLWSEADMKSLDESLGETSGRDRIDLGVTFLEMGLFSLAEWQFSHAVNARDASVALAARALEAYTRILGGRPFEAAMGIQSVVRDIELGPADKLEFYYLLGRAHEAMDEQDAASAWYARAAEVDPRYRDLEARQRRRRK